MASRSILKTVLLAAAAGVALGTAPAVAEDSAPVEAEAVTGKALDNAAYTPLNQLLESFGATENDRLEIAYAAIDDRIQAALDQYARSLGTVPVSELTREDQLAYWLNIRNTLIINAMAEERNRRRMSSSRGTYAEPGEMWTEARITIDGTEMSIDDIERAILTNFSDNPNVIYGLYQGTQGGASLPSEAYTAATLEAQLTSLGRDFVNSREGARARWGSVRMPEIYSWYQDALFNGDEALIKAHLIQLADEDLAEDLAEADELKQRKFSYSDDELIIRQQVRAPIGFGGGAPAAGGTGS